MIGATPDLEGVATVARRYPHTRFALISASVHDANFPANVTGITFDDREVGYLAGFLAALEGGRVPRVSAVAGQPTPAVRRIAAGARRARANVGVRVTYTDTFVDQRACERAANAQVDAGSKVVFDVAGPCGFGALQAVGIRGVWGIGVDTDLSSLGPQILASSVKRIDSGVRLATELYAAHRLPGGRDVLLDVGNDGVALVGMSDRVQPGGPHRGRAPRRRAADARSETLVNTGASCPARGRVIPLSPESAQPAQHAAEPRGRGRRSTGSRALRGRRRSP
jgi:basic membrane lipoprotein Med (substrate-binding protein (PBP1-ABC) superfamily)